MGSERPDRAVADVVLEPVPGERAAVATLDGERALVIGDYHAGYEAALRYERGVDVPSRAEERRERLRDVLVRTDVDRLVVCGDLMHSIGDPGGAERGELEVLFESLSSRLAVTIVKGNHDGAIETWLGNDCEGEDGGDGERKYGDDEGKYGDGHEGEGGSPEGLGGLTPSFEIVPGAGVRLGPLGVCHGHTWPAREVLEARVVCFGHEHPCVRLEDAVGGSRVEPVWLRGRLDSAAFAGRPEYDGLPWFEGGEPPRVVVLPAFNELVGGTWANVPGQAFLSPFLPEGLADGEAYLLDGTRLGPYRDV